jgi:transposase
MAFSGVLRTGAPWRDMPERCGNWNSVFVRFTRWSKIGVWDAAFGTLASLGPPGDKEHDRLLGDKGYDSDDIRNDLADRGIEPVIPPRSNRKTPIEYDRKAYKRRNPIERCVNRLR